MASGKRASMREGPLAALFRSTEEGQQERGGRSEEDAARSEEIRTRDERRRHRRSGRGARPRPRTQPRPDAAARAMRASRRRRSDCARLLARRSPRTSWSAPAETARHGRATRPGADPSARLAADAGPGPARGRCRRCRRQRRRPDDRGRDHGRRVHRGQHRHAVAGESQAPTRVHIGSDSTRGLGAGANPEMGRQAALEQYDELKGLLKGADMIFIAAGAGGGTGTGAAPVVARIAREVGALTVGIVTKPFAFEGVRRGAQADVGVDELRDEVDTLITIPNARLLNVLDKKTSMVEAFRVADDVLRQGVQGVSDLITLPGLINLDFADVRTIMSDAGPALLGHRHGHRRGPGTRRRLACRGVARCSRPRSMVRNRSCCRSRAVRICRSGRSTRRRRPSPTPPTPMRTSSLARWSTRSWATRCGSPSSRRATRASRRRGASGARRSSDADAEPRVTRTRPTPDPGAAASRRARRRSNSST